MPSGAARLRRLNLLEQAHRHQRYAAVAADRARWAKLPSSLVDLNAP